MISYFFAVQREVLFPLAQSFWLVFGNFWAFFDNIFMASVLTGQLQWKDSERAELPCFMFACATLPLPVIRGD